MALMALVVGRCQELLQAALGRRWTCGGPTVSLVMILSVDVAMRVDAASSASRGCLVWGWASVMETVRRPRAQVQVGVVEFRTHRQDRLDWQSRESATDVVWMDECYGIAGSWPRR